MNDPLLQKAIQQLASISLWRDSYPDGPDIFCDQRLEPIFTPEQVRAARKAVDASPVPDDTSFSDMLWKWFEDRGCDLRPERREGLTAADFKTMLDEHEAELVLCTSRLWSML